jgi:uncharacterized protein (TIGR03435 family)
MNALALRLAAGCVRAWTRLYTWRMPPVFRDIRRAEIESDLWEFQSDAADDATLDSALHVLLRLVIGIPDDVGWRLEHSTVAGTATQESIALTARLAGAAFFIAALWIIDVDAHRQRPPLAVESAPAVVRHPAAFEQDTDGIRTMRAGIVAAVGVSMTSQLAPQSAPIAASDPAFEVASVKPNRSGDAGWRLDPQPGGRLTGTNVTAAALIRFAYELPDFQMFGGPKWLNSDRFDVVAKAEGDPPLKQRRLMLRTLMAERFKLTAHTETRELPIFALVLARNDGRIGPQLRRTEADCAGVDRPSLDLGVGPSPSTGPPRCGYFGFAPGADFRSGRGGLGFRGLTMAAFAKILVPMVRRSVDDQTGLTGYFDAEFDFMAELPAPPPPPGVSNPFGNEFSSVFTVLPEQLGLKLKPATGPVEVLVIDRVEPPSQQ